MNAVHVYIETSLKWPRKGSGIVGIVFTDDADTYSKTLFGRVNDSTEHHSLLVALDKALDYLGSYEEIHVHTNCGYIAGGFKNLSSWEENKWFTSKGETVKFAEIWQNLASKTRNKQLKVHLNEFNGYRTWLKNECDMRGRKHGFIL